MENNLNALNNKLFEMMERLMDDDLTEEQFAREVARGKAIEGIADKSIRTFEVALKAYATSQEFGATNGGNPSGALPKMLEAE